MAVVQVWGCNKCTFRYESPVKVHAMEHHCPPKSSKTATAIFISGEPPEPKPKKIKPKVKEPEPSPRRGLVLKRRRSVVK